MTASTAAETTLLRQQVQALERETEFLKDRLAAAADEIAKRDRIIADLNWRIHNRSHRY